MQTIISYHSPLTWFSPFAELCHFEPISGLNHSESTIENNAQAYQIRYNLPGFRKKDLKIEIDNNFLTIKGTKTKQSNRWLAGSADKYEQQFLRQTRLSSDMDMEHFNKWKAIQGIREKRVGMHR